MQKTGIILVGGKSSRMGKNKALLKVGGKTVVEKIADDLKTIVEQIIIVTNNFEDYEFLQLPMVEDKWKGLGPLAGIHAGLTASQTDKNLIVACDMPFISASVGAFILSELSEVQAVVPEISGELHPLFAGYKKEVLPEVEKSLEKEQLKLKRFLKSIHTKILTEKDLTIKGIEYKDYNFFNMNNPTEYEKAQIMENSKEV